MGTKKREISELTKRLKELSQRMSSFRTGGSMPGQGGKGEDQAFFEFSRLVFGMYRENPETIRGLLEELTDLDILSKVISCLAYDEEALSDLGIRDFVLSRAKSDHSELRFSVREFLGRRGAVEDFALVEEYLAGGEEGYWRGFPWLVNFVENMRSRCVSILTKALGSADPMPAFLALQDLVYFRCDASRNAVGSAVDRAGDPDVIAMASAVLTIWEEGFSSEEDVGQRLYRQYCKTRGVEAR